MPFNDCDRQDAADLCQRLASYGFEFSAEAVSRIVAARPDASDADRWRLLGELVWGGEDEGLSGTAGER